MLLLLYFIYTIICHKIASPTHQNPTDVSTAPLTATIAELCNDSLYKKIAVAMVAPGLLLAFYAAAAGCCGSRGRRRDGGVVVTGALTLCEQLRLLAFAAFTLLPLQQLATKREVIHDGNRQQRHLRSGGGDDEHENKPERR